MRRKEGGEKKKGGKESARHVKPEILRSKRRARQPAVEGGGNVFVLFGCGERKGGGAECISRERRAGTLSGDRLEKKETRINPTSLSAKKREGKEEETYLREIPVGGKGTAQIQVNKRKWSGGKKG